MLTFGCSSWYPIGNENDEEVDGVNFRAVVLSNTMGPGFVFTSVTAFIAFFTMCSAESGVVHWQSYPQVQSNMRVFRAVVCSLPDVAAAISRGWPYIFATYKLCTGRYRATRSPIAGSNLLCRRNPVVVPYLCRDFPCCRHRPSDVLRRGAHDGAPSSRSSSRRALPCRRRPTLVLRK